ncbi:MAG TPA: UDP binding domain-containing protein, partial [bacterium]|nr:UDP binding domain-containing protein [bacterium]
LRLIELLLEHGAKVRYHDPFVGTLPPTRKYRYRLKSTPLTAARLKAADAVLIATDHSCVDYRLVGEAAALVVDTRNVMARVGKVKARVVRA